MVGYNVNLDASFLKEQKNVPVEWLCETIVECPSFSL
jgi:hypothetical protein